MVLTSKLYLESNCRTLAKHRSSVILVKSIKLLELLNWDTFALSLLYPAFKYFAWQLVFKALNA